MLKNAPRGCTARGKVNTLAKTRIVLHNKRRVCTKKRGNYFGQATE